MDQKKESKLLPSNAYTKLAPGEEYQPVVPADDTRAEVTAWSIGLGIVMVIVFTAACSYMSLRAGNAIEAARTGASRRPSAFSCIAKRTAESLNPN